MKILVSIPLLSLIHILMFEDKRCDCGEFKLTDGFHDKYMKWNSEKIVGISILPKEKINLERIAKRMRSTRSWPVSYTHLDVYKRQELFFPQKRLL